VLRTAFLVLFCILIIDKNSIRAWDCTEKEIRQIQTRPPVLPKDHNNFLLPPDDDQLDPSVVPDDSDDDGDDPATV
jgi:hypothetical protein